MSDSQNYFNNLHLLTDLIQFTEFTEFNFKWKIPSVSSHKAASKIGKKVIEIFPLKILNSVLQTLWTDIHCCVFVTIIPIS